MRISDWSSDVCSSDLIGRERPSRTGHPWPVMVPKPCARRSRNQWRSFPRDPIDALRQFRFRYANLKAEYTAVQLSARRPPAVADQHRARRSEEHTSELQSLMRTSYAVFCLKKKTQ